MAKAKARKMPKGDQQTPGKGATMDGPTPPEHANLSKPNACISCHNCGLVYAGRGNCPNRGVDASGEAFEAYNEALAKAGLPPVRR